ncbi:uridine kinase [Motilimonas pumila]|uniref:Uridine kinase n=1 Tax=Motilimonas pumila TaxID=2303987 RepID=A0A418YCQ3_9GAMM|nr:uridine kinase [Motilimonas pumila]RJG42283.1 uridine kinase [Motilimonas pumila]
MTATTQQAVIIAIAGASASGKSLIAQSIYRKLRKDFGPDEIGVISEDRYYRDQSHLPMEQRALTNYDHPCAMEHELLAEHLRTLQQGNTVHLPNYSYSQHTRVAETTEFKPKKVIILEGILLLNNAEVRDIMHTGVYMDTPLDICFLRRLQRDVQERGRSMESVIKQYQETVRPMFLQFIEPSKQYADLIVPRGGKNKIAIDLLAARIRQFLKT